MKTPVNTSAFVVSRKADATRNPRGKGERVECLEPTVVSMAPLSRGSHDQLCSGHVGLISDGGG